MKSILFAIVATMALVACGKKEEAPAAAPLPNAAPAAAPAAAPTAAPASEPAKTEEAKK